MRDAVLRTAPGYVQRSDMALAGRTTLDCRTRHNSYLWSLLPVACEWANPPGPIRIIRWIGGETLKRRPGAARRESSRESDGFSFDGGMNES